MVKEKDKDLRLRILVGLLVIFVLLGGFYLWLQPQTPPPPAPSEIPARLPPEEVVEFFYSWYLDADGLPLKNGEHQARPDLSEEFKQRLTGVAENGHQPILCTPEEKPVRFLIRPAEIVGTQAKIEVEEDFAGQKRLVEVTLELTGDDWQITDISCSPLTR